MANTARLVETIRKALTSGGPGDIAKSTVEFWGRVSAQLSPVIGARGVEVLFTRSLQLSSRTFPWLGGASDPGTPAIETLRARLENRGGADAAEAGTAVLASLVELLGTLIGTSLSEQLLAPVWEPPAARPKEENLS